MKEIPIPITYPSEDKPDQSSAEDALAEMVSENQKMGLYDMSHVMPKHRPEDRPSDKSNLVNESVIDQSYLVNCARCGKELPVEEAIIEEGDEWECVPCWERCNASEKKKEK